MAALGPLMPECASRYLAPGTGISTVNTSVEQPAALARSSTFCINLRSRNTYSWNHIGRLIFGVTSSIGQTDTVDMVNGMPFLSAAMAAWTSPRRAYIPVKPTGESATGKDSCSPKISVDKSSCVMSFSTRWRKAILDKSSTLRFRVYSAYAPPSM